MVLGSYYLTLVKTDEPGTNKVFRDKDEAIMAYNDGIVGLHAPIRVRMYDENGVASLVWSQLVSLSLMSLFLKI